MQSTGRLWWEGIAGAGPTIAGWASSPFSHQSHSFGLQAASSPGLGHAALKLCCPRLVPNPGPANTSSVTHVIRQRLFCHTAGGLSLPVAGRETEPPQGPLAFRHYSVAGDWPVPDPGRQRHPLDTRKGSVRLGSFVPFPMKYFSILIS